MDKAAATQKFEEPPDDIDAKFHVNKSCIDPQDEIAHVKKDFTERIEQAKAEAVKSEAETMIAAKQAAFADLEDDLYDRLSDITMLATFSTMQEVWPVEETRL